MQRRTDFGSPVRIELAEPYGVGSLDTDLADTVSGEAGARSRGAWVRIYLRLEGRRIAQARFHAWGGPAIIAAASYCARRLNGAPARMRSIPTGLDLANALDFPRAEAGSALLVEDAARKALSTWLETQPCRGAEEEAKIDSV